MPVARVGSIQIAYEASGPANGPAILLIRGTGSQLVHWHPKLIELLESCGLRVIRFDNRDAGASTNFEHLGAPSMGELMQKFMTGQPLNPPYTLEDMAGDVTGLMDTLGVKRAHLLGYSLGAMVAQIVSARHPDRVISLVSLMSSPLPPNPQNVSPKLMQLMMQGPAGTGAEAEAEHALAVARLFAGDKYPLDDETYRKAHEQARARGIWPGGEMRQVSAMLATGDRSELCRQIKAPTLVIHGTADPTLPVEEAQRTADLIPGARLAIFKDMGHDLTPGAIAEVAPVLREHFAGGRG
jgi:pimeloyl-ACP methyl ester carboxylesterase